MFHAIAQTIDTFITNSYTFFFKEKKSLICVLFHGLFRDKTEIDSGAVDPQQSITVEIFQEFIEYFIEQEYVFVSPNDIVEGLDDKKNHILITFDDGYYNNHLALPILEKFHVPALFFISTDHVIQNKCFWWDVIYRERRREGAGIDKINREIERMKQKKNHEIENYILDIFGEESLLPIGDIDRPFMPDELKSFSRSPFVFLGNHTSSHAILSNYSHDEIRNEIENAQNRIFEITGVKPCSIAYPNGNYTDEVLKVCEELGLKIGITTKAHKNYLPIRAGTKKALELNRFILWGDRDIESQCRSFRSDLQPLAFAKRIVKRN